MSSPNENPFAIDSRTADPQNPYAAPQMMDDVATEGGVALADRMTRLGGAIIDGLILAPVQVLLFFGLAAIAIDQGDATDNFIVFQFVTSIGSIFCVAVAYLLINGYLLARRGQTIGKLAVGIRIVNAETNELVPLAPLFLKRWLLIQGIALIPIIGWIISLVDVLLIFRENRRCLHDDFAGTKVIKVLKH